MKSFTKISFILSTLLLSLNAFAGTISVSCDNEADESSAGQTYYEVEGKLNLNNSTPENLTLKYKEVAEMGSNKVLAIFYAKNLKHEEKDGNKTVYSFKGDILGVEHKVKISITLNEIAGLSYSIKVNDTKLRWCAPPTAN